MPRILGKSVTVCDSVLDDEPQGRVHVLLLDDAEEVPLSAEAVEEFLARETESNDVVAEKMIEAALDMDEKDAEDPLKRVLATMAAMVADETKEATDWKAARMGDVADAGGAGPAAEGLGK